MTKLLKLLFVVDYIIIIFKIIIFFYVLIHFETATNSFGKEIYSYYLLPFGTYSIINLLRFFFRLNKYLLYSELLLNVIFMFVYIFPHELRYLI